MNAEEANLITGFVQRVGGTPALGSIGGSVPATQPAAPEAPVDPQADALIGDLFNRYPQARYRITQLAFVQEHAMAEAQNVITRLQWELQQARQQLQTQQPPQQASPWGAPVQPQAQPQQSRGFFGNMFGGNQAAPPPQPQYAQPQYAPQPQYAAPPPQYAPGYQPGMFQRPGGGFLGSALTTAAGVAGGMVAGNAIMGLFSGNHSNSGGMFGGSSSAPSGGGGGSSFSDPGYNSQPASGWAGQPAPDPYDQGGAQKDWSDQSSSGGWTDSSSSDPGGSDWGGSDPD